MAAEHIGRERRTAAMPWRVARDEHGAAALEFALLAPLMALLAVAGVDLVHAAQAAAAAEAQARARLSAVVRAAVVPAPDTAAVQQNSGPRPMGLPPLLLPALPGGTEGVRLFWACPLPSTAAAMKFTTTSLPGKAGAASLPGLVGVKSAGRCGDGSRPAPYAAVEVALAADSLTGFNGLATLAGGSARAIARLG